jgi:hypothetical protein
MDKGTYGFFFYQLYLVRNIIFEPSTVSDKKKAVRTFIHDIKRAFRFKKPAIISMHRLNFMGELNPNNRKENLKLFKDALLEIIKEYPQVEFMTSPELAQLIKV